MVAGSVLVIAPIGTKPLCPGANIAPADSTLTGPAGACLATPSVVSWTSRSSLDTGLCLGDVMSLVCLSAKIPLLTPNVAKFTLLSGLMAVGCLEPSTQSHLFADKGSWQRDRIYNTKPSVT